MKFASRKSGRDGQLLIVSRDLARAVDASPIAPTLQSALDNWGQVESELQSLYDALNDGTASNAFAFDSSDVMAPLPRAYQYLDGACYISHIRRNREARGDALPDDILDAPLIYQGISHGFRAWNETLRMPHDDQGVDFEAEIAAITGDVPMGVSADNATDYIRLFVLLNDMSLRSIIPGELKRSFGFLTGKPASSLGPVAVTPDELGPLWDGRMVSGRMKTWVRGELLGDMEAGIDSPFHYGDAIAHVAQTRDFEPGTIIGLGTVSNEDASAGFGCIGEARCYQIVESGEPSIDFLKFGDTLRIELCDYEGNSVMGAIEQSIEPA